MYLYEAIISRVIKRERERERESVCMGVPVKLEASKGGIKAPFEMLRAQKKQKFSCIIFTRVPSIILLLTLKDSVTRWLDFLSLFGNLQQLKFAQNL